MRRLVVGLLLTLAAACSSSPGPTVSADPVAPPSTTAAAPSPAAPVSPILVEMIDHRDAPCCVLRLEPVPGDTQRTPLQLDRRFEQADLGVTGLTFEIVLETQISAVTPDLVTLDYAYEEVALVATEGVDNSARSLMADSFETIGGVHGTQVMDHHGRPVEVDVVLPAEIDASMAAVIDDTTGPFHVIAPPLPAVPVSIGDRWRVTVPTEQEGARFVNVYDYELIDLEDSRFTLAVTWEQSIDAPQVLDQPGSPVTTLTEHHGSGTGTLVGDLTSLVLVDGHFTSTVTRTIESRGESFDSLLTIELDVGPPELP